MNWFIKCLRQYADFKGRAQRAEYWYFSLFYFLAYVVGFILDNALGTQSRHKDAAGLVTFLIFVGLCVPAMSVTIRRLHDTGRSGWWLLLLALPAVVGGVLMVFGGLAVVAAIGFGVEMGLFGLGTMMIGALIALGGAVWWVYVFVQPSQPGMNEYGPPPGVVVTEG